MNFLEQLVAEWYEYKGYFVRRNVLVGRRVAGGYECELDVVAFHPKKKHLVHVEPSNDAQSFKKREQRFQKKFAAGRKYIPELFAGLPIPSKIEQYSVLGFAAGKGRDSIGGCPFKRYEDLLLEILGALREIRPETNAVPESLPLLRMLQTVTKYRKSVADLLRPAR